MISSSILQKSANGFWSKDDEKPTLLQCFHWYYPAGGKLWREVTALAPNLNEIGINMIWLPPACKGHPAGILSAMTPMTCSILASLTRKAVSPRNMATRRSCWRPLMPSKVTTLPYCWTWWSTTKWAPMKKSPCAFSA